MSLANFNESKVGECGWSWLAFSNSNTSLNSLSKWIICTSLTETAGHCRPLHSYYNYYCNLIAPDERGEGCWSSGMVKMICNELGQRDLLLKAVHKCTRPFPALFGGFIKRLLQVDFNMRLSWFNANTCYCSQFVPLASEERIISTPCSSTGFYCSHMFTQVGVFVLLDHFSSLARLHNPS